MALIKCKECSNEVSTKATACPKCGAKMPKRTSLFTKIVLGLIGIGVLGSIFGGKSEGTPKSATAQATAVGSNAPASDSTAQASAPSVKPAPKAGAAVAALSKKTDKIEGIDWYNDRSSPSTHGTNNVKLYMGVKSGSPWLRVLFEYAGSDWLFIKKALIVIDGNKAGEVSGSWEKDNNTTVWEWLDLSVDANNLALVKAMANAKSVVIRYEGRQYIKDRTLTGAELKAMRNVLAAYGELGGN